jgi:hypothetical protein
MMLLRHVVTPPPQLCEQNEGKVYRSDFICIRFLEYINYSVYCFAFI